jgi:hypothetical protein
MFHRIYHSFIKALLCAKTFSFDRQDFAIEKEGSTVSSPRPFLILFGHLLPSPVNDAGGANWSTKLLVDLTKSGNGFFVYLAAVDNKNDSGGDGKGG